MATNGRKRYFNIEQTYVLLDDAESGNLINDSDTDFIAEEEITQVASTQDTSLTTPETILHIVPSDNQLKKK